MLSFILMILFSLYLAGYGFMALFKQEWLTKLAAFATGGKIKREDYNQSGSNKGRFILGVMSFALGLIGLGVSVVALVLYVASLSGPIDV